MWTMASGAKSLVTSTRAVDGHHMVLKPGAAAEIDSEVPVARVDQTQGAGN